MREEAHGGGHVRAEVAARSGSGPAPVRPLALITHTMPPPFLPPTVAADGEACALYALAPPATPVRPPLLILHANGFSGRW